MHESFNWLVHTVPRADHRLAQPLKRCSASRIKPNETFELAKKRQNILCFGVCGCEGEIISLRCRQVTSKVSKTVKNPSGRTFRANGLTDFFIRCTDWSDSTYKRPSSVLAVHLSESVSPFARNIRPWQHIYSTAQGSNTIVQIVS